MQLTRMSATAHLAARAVIAAGVCAAVLMPHAAQAQLSVINTHASLRLGAYITTNPTTQQQIGKTLFSAGLDYYFQQTGISERSVASVDYLERSGGSTNLQVVPITVGEQYVYSARSQGIRPYFGFGVGAYLIHVKNPRNANLTGGQNSGPNNDSSNGTSFGGYGAVGLDLSNNLFVDARYHLVTPYKSTNADGLELTAGLRF